MISPCSLTLNDPNVKTCMQHRLDLHIIPLQCWVNAIVLFLWSFKELSAQFLVPMLSINPYIAEALHLGASISFTDILVTFIMITLIQCKANLIACRNIIGLCFHQKWVTVPCLIYRVLSYVSKMWWTEMAKMIFGFKYAYLQRKF